MIGMWDKEKKELEAKQPKPKFTSKELYNMLRQSQKDTLPVLRIHYMSESGTSIFEKCGLLRVRDIKKIAKKVFSIRYNRKELMKHALSTS